MVFGVLDRRAGANNSNVAASRSRTLRKALFGAGVTSEVTAAEKADSVV